MRCEGRRPIGFGMMKRISRGWTRMNTDKKTLFIGVDRRLSAAQFSVH
jgi:hypothetical protein